MPIGPRSSPLRLTGAVALLIVAAGCNGDDDAAATTAPPPTTTQTTEPPATTAPPETTEPTTPPSTATTAPPATTESTPTATTEPSDEEIKQAVIDAAVTAWQTYTNALRDPLNESRLVELTATNSGLTLERRLARVAELATSGLVAVEHPEFPASITIYEDTLVVDTVAGTASIEYCRVGSDLGVEIGGNPDGSDRIMVDEVNAYHERADLEFNDGTWFDSDGSLIELFSGASECDI